LVSSSILLTATADSRLGNVNNNVGYDEQRASRLQTDNRRKKKHIIDSQKRKLKWGSVTWMDGGNSPTDNKNDNDSNKAAKSSKRKGRTKGKARKHIDDDEWGHSGLSNNTSSILPQPTTQSLPPPTMPPQQPTISPTKPLPVLTIVGDDNDPEHAFPLAECHGDCDEDTDCAEGLHCYMREDIEEVPGCQGSGESGKDYCFKPTPIDLIIKGDNNDPEHAFPLMSCQGDCDEDTDCAEGLHCFKRDDLEEVPGCRGKGVKDYDYCFMPGPTDLIIKGDDNDPDHAFPLMSCQGDCDEDEDCAEGLHCFKRDEYEEVPGCQGKGNKGSDYCYYPAAMEEMSSNTTTSSEDGTPSSYTPTSFPSASPVDNAASNEMSSGGRFPTILWPPPPTPSTSSPSSLPVSTDNLLFGTTSPAAEMTSSPSLSSTSEDTNTTSDTSSSSVGTLIMPPPLTDIEMDLFGIISLNPIERNVFQTQTSNYINSFYNDVTNSSDIRANVTVVTSSIDVTDEIVPMFVGTSTYPDADCTEIIPLTVKFGLKLTLYTTNEDTDYEEVVTYPFSTVEFQKLYVDEYLKANDEMGYQDLKCISSIRIPSSDENAAGNSTTEEEEVEGEEEEELPQDMPTLPPVGDTNTTDTNATNDESAMESEAPSYAPTSGMPTYSPSASEESVDLRMNHPDIYERKCDDNPEVSETDIDEYEVSFEYGVDSTSNTIHFIDELGRMILDFLAISVMRCSETGQTRSQGGSVVSIILANTEVWSCDPYEQGCGVLNTKLLITSSGLATSHVHRDILSVLQESFKEGMFTEFIPELTTTSYLGPEPEVFSFIESEETINEESNAAGIIFRVSCAFLILFGVSVLVLVASMVKCPGKLPDKVIMLLNGNKYFNAIITKKDTKKEDEASDIDTVEDDSSQLLQGSVVAL